MTATAAVILYPRDKVAGMHWMFITEALRGKQGFATAGATIANEADLVLNILAKLNQVLLTGFVQQLFALRRFDTTGIVATNERGGHRIKGHADIHLGVAGPVLMLTLVAAVTEANPNIGGCLYNLCRPLIIQNMQGTFITEDFLLNKNPAKLGVAGKKQFANKIFLNADVLLVEFT